MTTSPKFDLPQGTLDLLILRVVPLGPVHGYAIAQRIQQVSASHLSGGSGAARPSLVRGLATHQRNRHPTRARCYSLRNFLGSVASVRMAGVNRIDRRRRRNSRALPIIRRGLYGVSGLDPISYAGTIALLIAI